ncbi:hypothetical protein EV360DRAFT_73848 [Lentinula raphanica]|nr:hypothetical protein EV360DRAFT_73848 [Lentinula raphanica]
MFFTAKSVIQIFHPAAMPWLSMTMERAIVNCFIVHGILIFFLITGKVLDSMYEFIIATFGTDPGDIVANVLLVTCAWIISWIFVLDLKSEVGGSQLVFSLSPKVVGFLVLLSTLTFAYAIWCFVSILDLSFWLGVSFKP